MTNPDNTVGTNAGFNGRTTPNAFNDVLATFSGRGIISGWTCSPKSGMTIQLGGNGSDRDVAIAEDNAGNKTTINNRTATPVEITLDGAPATNNRIDSIVAYVDNPQQGAGSTDVDFPSQVGIIAVKGTVAATPSAPTEAQIRTAITADGATGASAYYVVLANITVGTGVTTIGSGVIAQGFKTTPHNATANNLKPSADTPAAWRGVTPNESYVFTMYNQSGCFTNQPSTYGQLETIRNAGEIYQRWHTQSNGETFYRAGNAQGWWGQSGGSGAFRKIIDNSQSATVTSNMIDWTTIIQSISDSSATNSGYLDLGTVRIQWMTRTQTGLNQGAGSYNGWTATWPVSFASAYYSAVISPASDTINVAGGELIIATRTASGVSVNYNHTGAIGSSSISYCVIGIGRKP